jgi:hypothetical protein
MTLHYATRKPHWIPRILLASLFGLVTSCQITTNSGADDAGTMGAPKDYPSLTRFDKIDIGSGFRVTVQQGAAHSVKVTAAEKYEPYVDVKEKNGTLYVSLKPNDGSNTIIMGSPGTVDIVLPTLIAAKLSSGASAELTNIKADALSVNATSGTVVTLSGSAKSLLLTIDSGASFDGYAATAETVEVTADAGAKAKVSASVKLKASASSGGTVTYKGTATVTKDESSGGSVTQE